MMALLPTGLMTFLLRNMNQFKTKYSLTKGDSLQYLL